MKWEAVSGITGIISAAVALLSVRSLLRPIDIRGVVRGSERSKLKMYLLFCSGWVLCVIAYNWCMEPFGPYVTEREEKLLYGAMLVVPALSLTIYAGGRLADRREGARSEK